MIHKSVKYMCNKVPIYCFTAQSNDNQDEMYSVFDTDSYPIVVDTGCSRTVSAYSSDFMQDTLRSPQGEPNQIRGIAGASASIKKIGTIKWTILVDEGVRHDILLPNSRYIPTLNARLMSPQHFAQTSNVDVNCVLSATELIIQWDKGKYSKTASITKEGSNIATIWAAPGYMGYAAFQSIMTRSKTQESEGATAQDDEELK